MPEASPNSPMESRPPSSSSTTCTPSSSSSSSSRSERYRGGSGKKLIILRRYEVGRLLGCGAFAKVYYARHIDTGQSVALKVLSKPKLLNSGLAGNVRREIFAMRRLRHSNILRLLDVLASRSCIYLVLEFAKGGELFSCVSARGRLPEEVARQLFHQLLSAVAYAHAHGVFHRDLKLENILLLDDFPCPRLKISDFGLAALADRLRPPDDHNPLLFKTLCGTPAYVAPEVLSRRPYNAAKADLWSCGVVLFVLVAGYLPFNDRNLMELYRKICRAELRFPRWISPDIRRLLGRLLHPNPAARISTAEIVHDPWFRKGLDANRFASVIRPNCQDLDSLIAAKIGGEDESQVRDLNAFDLIALSPALDISGLFSGTEPAALLRARERFVSNETAEVIFARVESASMGEEMAVRRLGKAKQVGAAVEGPAGELMVWLEVRRLNDELVLVEVETGGMGAAGEFWRKRLRPELRPSTCEPVRPASGSNGSEPELTILEDAEESGSTSPA
ncbi:hypothetical protein Cni_G25410 [Canna indica]|uniref:non-specific serine/threonine protein kinase n=1 Tax=Canna indica TaxID=4628 RepID=A0AAQ3L4A8_9LILI|nr:hypothetical protein Cni_G25410 [Canna indica]